MLDDLDAFLADSLGGEDADAFDQRRRALPGQQPPLADLEPGKEGLGALGQQRKPKPAGHELSAAG